MTPIRILLTLRNRSRVYLCLITKWIETEASKPPPCGNANWLSRQASTRARNVYRILLIRCAFFLLHKLDYWGTLMARREKKGDENVQEEKQERKNKITLCVTQWGLLTRKEDTSSSPTVLTDKEKRQWDGRKTDDRQTDGLTDSQTGDSRR